MKKLYEIRTEDNKKDSRTNTNTTRREVLQGAVGVGAVGVGVNGLVVESARAATAKRETITIGFESKDSDSPVESFSPVTTEVPADWYTNLERARQVNERIKEKFVGQQGVVGIGVVPGEYGGENASVKVDLLPEDADQLRGQIPEYVDDIPVKTALGSEITPDDHSPCDDGNSYCNQGDFGYSIPGGVQCQGDSYGTLSTKIYDENGNERFVTAGHLYDDADANGQSLYHPDDGSSSIGEIVRSHCYDDIVLAKEKNYHSPERKITDANPEDVNGQFTKDGVADLKAAGEYVRKVGRTTCGTCGKIEYVDYTTWLYGCTPKDGQVVWGEGNDSKGGDSGAPVYHQNPNDSSYQWIVSFDLWSGDYSTGGTSAWSIKNKHGYHF